MNLRQSAYIGPQTIRLVSVAHNLPSLRRWSQAKKVLAQYKLQTYEEAVVALAMRLQLTELCADKVPLALRPLLAAMSGHRSRRSVLARATVELLLGVVGSETCPSLGWKRAWRGCRTRRCDDVVAR